MRSVSLCGTNYGPYKFRRGIVLIIVNVTGPPDTRSKSGLQCIQDYHRKCYHHSVQFTYFVMANQVMSIILVSILTTGE